MHLLGWLLVTAGTAEPHDAEDHGWYEDRSPEYRYVLTQPLVAQQMMNPRKHRWNFVNDEVPCIRLESGLLTLGAGFLWNGPSVIPDGPKVLEASAYHDALYRLMRAKAIDRHRRTRTEANRIFERVAWDHGHPAPHTARHALNTFGWLATRNWFPSLPLTESCDVTVTSAAQ